MQSSLQRLARVLMYGSLALVAVIIVAVGAVAFMGGRAFAEPFDAPAHDLAIPDDSASVAEGERLARFWGCVGCHERDGGGHVFIETPLGDRLVAPNLTRVVHEYDAGELEGAIRHGVRPDGSSLVGMPSSMFNGMSDADLGRVIAYLRTLPPVPDTVARTRMGLLARWLVLRDVVPLQAAAIDQAADHPPSPDSLGPDATREDTLALGRYLARTGCTECHGLDLRGSDDGSIPDLRIAAAYDLDTFRRLAREGLMMDGTERPMMTEIARGRLSVLTDDEVAALHAYLVTLAD